MNVCVHKLLAVGAAAQSAPTLFLAQKNIFIDFKFQPYFTFMLHNNINNNNRALVYVYGPLLVNLRGRAVNHSCAVGSDNVART